MIVRRIGHTEGTGIVIHCERELEAEQVRLIVECKSCGEKNVDEMAAGQSEILYLGRPCLNCGKTSYKISIELDV